MVEEKIDKDGFIVTTQEESVPKEDREFAINVYSNSSRAARLFVLKRFTQKTENSLVSKVFLI